MSDRCIPASAPAPSTTSTPVIDVRGLTCRYGKHTALQEVSWRVEPGHVVGVLGRNGAGKSTLLHCVLGLLDATAGTCTLLGEDAPNASDAVKARLGFVPQQPALPGWPTAARLLRHHQAFYPRWDAALVERLLSRFGVDPARRVGALSLGQQQGLSLAMALGPMPELLILDEPAAALDPVARRVFQEAVLEVVIDGTRSVVLSSHLTGDVERVCDRVLLLDHGAVTFDGDLGELKGSVKRVRIDSPTVLPLQPSLPVPTTEAKLLAWEVQGTTALATIRATDPVAVLTAAFPAATFDIQDLGLEDLLVEIHR